MHTVQLAAEDYGVKNDGTYANLYSDFSGGLPTNFKNPFSSAATAGEDRASTLNAPTATPGISSYADTSQLNYNVKGYGKSAALALVLSAGQ